MIKASIISSDASLNNFAYIGGISFVPGENVTVCFQLINSQRNIRFIPPSNVEVEATLILKDETELLLTASQIDPDDRSLWKIELSQAQSEQIGSQNIKLKIDLEGDGSDIRLFMIYGALQPMNISGEC